MERIGRVRSFSRRNNILYPILVPLLQNTWSDVSEELDNMISVTISYSIQELCPVGNKKNEPTQSGLCISPVERKELEKKLVGPVNERDTYQITLRPDRNLCTRFRLK